MKKTILILASAAVLAAACGGPLSPQDKLTVNDKKINEIIAQMTLEEKVNMLHSKTNMSSAGVERLGIADMNYADGPFGIREEGVPNGFQSAGWTLDSATYFQNPCCRGNGGLPYAPTPPARIPADCLPDRTVQRVRCRCRRRPPANISHP